MATWGIESNCSSSLSMLGRFLLLCQGVSKLSNRRKQGSEDLSLVKIPAAMSPPLCWGIPILPARTLSRASRDGALVQSAQNLRSPNTSFTLSCSIMDNAVDVFPSPPDPKRQIRGNVPFVWRVQSISDSLFTSSVLP